MSAKPKGLDRINAAAAKVIGSKGFAEATTLEIAAAAGVSEGLIFRYYKTKLDLGQALFKKHYQEVLDRLVQTALKHEDPIQRVRGVAKDFYLWFDENRDVAQFLIRTHQEFLDKTDHQQGFMFLAGVALKQILGEALFLLFPSDIMAAMLVGAFLQVCVECMHGQVQGPLAPQMEGIIDAMTSLLSRAAPAAKGKESESQDQQ